MALQILNPQQIAEVLDRQRIVRLGFSADGDSFVVPVFFVHHNDALFGLTTPGRKTALAEKNATVAFQIDTTASTGPWEWSSVSGHGLFSVVTDRAEIGEFAPLLQAKLADAPAWAAAALMERFATLGRVPWKLVPSEISGRSHGP